MTTSELIAVLQTYPPDARVVVDGYEGDADDIADVKIRHVEIGGNLKARNYGSSSGRLTVPNDCGAGEHRFVDDDEDGVAVVWLRRKYWGGEG